MGPATEDGFYFDFELDEKIGEDAFPKIEKEMQKIIDANYVMTKQLISLDQAKNMPEFIENPYKMEWIDSIAHRGEKISIYVMGDIEVDLCSGPPLTSTGEVKAFKLLSVAGAYWHGDEKNKMLTRIYGTAFFSQAELDEYLARVEESKRRDHRKLGAELDLFTFSDLVGKGLPIWTPKGATIRRELEKFIVDEELKRGYLHVYTPDIAKLDLYRTSGHYPYYKDTMYAPITIDDEEYMLRPMTCPHHFEFYKSKPHSYKELPMRIAELAKLYRYEKSGELTGLSRVRSFCLADAHIIAIPSQAKAEINRVLDLIDDIAQLWGLKAGENYRYRLSLGDRKDEKKYFKDDASWDYAENVLRGVLLERKAEFYEAENEAAFYGPKIDVQMKNVLGKEDTAFTVQYDFVMPKRFALEYTDSEGKKQEPIVIHRSSIGAIERTMAFLIEHFAGAFPLWLSPVQAVVIPISQDQGEYGESVVTSLREAGLRAELWNEAESMQKRIRSAEEQKIPYMLVVGGREAEAGNVSVRARGQKDQSVMRVGELVEKLVAEVKEKRR